MTKRTRASNGMPKFGMDTVAQIYKRQNGAFTFRWHDERRYRYARELAGHDLGWPSYDATAQAARGFGIKNHVRIW
jgi:hypothetical protein